MFIASYFYKDLRAILGTTPAGQDALEYYCSNKTLAPKHQQDIVNCIIDNCLAGGQKLLIKDMEALADCICTQFKGESAVSIYLLIFNIIYIIVMLNRLHTFVGVVKNLPENFTTAISMSVKSVDYHLQVLPAPWLVLSRSAKTVKAPAMK